MKQPRYVVVIIALEGTVSVCGPFRDEYAATLAANELETEETGYATSVCELESPDLDYKAIEEDRQ